MSFANAHHAEFFRQLFEETVCKLAGRTVQVRFRQPYGADALGETYLDHGGLAIIDIRPSLPLEKQFEVLLHEAADIKAGHLDMVGPTDFAFRPSGSAVPVHETKAGEMVAKSMEDEAQAPADKWDEWASRRIEARNLGQEDAEGRIIAKLVCLQNYKDGLNE